jgi:arylsulfatase A-like enzyme
VFTADHGLSPLPETLTETKMPGGRISNAALFGPAQAAIEARFGQGRWILNTAGTSPYLNDKLIQDKGIDEAEVQRVAATALLSVPHVLRVFTRAQLLLGQVPPDRFSQRVLRSFNPKRSGDIEVLLEPYWIRSSTGTTHGTPYSYDTHVPLIFLGPGIKQGRFYREVALNDVAPTIATILDVEIPSGSAGRVLDEIMQH